MEVGTEGFLHKDVWDKVSANIQFANAKHWTQDVLKRCEKLFPFIDHVLSLLLCQKWVEVLKVLTLLLVLQRSRSVQENKSEVAFIAFFELLDTFDHLVHSLLALLQLAASYDFSLICSKTLKVISRVELVSL